MFEVDTLVEFLGSFKTTVVPVIQGQFGPFQLFRFSALKSSVVLFTEGHPEGIEVGTLEAFCPNRDPKTMLLFRATTKGFGREYTSLFAPPIAHNNEYSVPYAAGVCWILNLTEEYLVKLYERSLGPG